MFTCEVFDKEPNEFCIRSQMENRQEQIATNMQEMSIYSIQVDHRTPKSQLFLLLDRHFLWRKRLITVSSLEKENSYRRCLCTAKAQLWFCFCNLVQI